MAKWGLHLWCGLPGVFHFAIGLMASYTGITSDLTNGGRIWVNGGKNSSLDLVSYTGCAEFLRFHQHALEGPAAEREANDTKAGESVPTARRLCGPFSRRVLTTP